MGEKRGKEGEKKGRAIGGILTGKKKNWGEVNDKL